MSEAEERRESEADGLHVLGNRHLPGENLPGLKPAMKDNC